MKVLAILAVMLMTCIAVTEAQAANHHPAAHASNANHHPAAHAFNANHHPGHYHFYYSYAPDVVYAWPMADAVVAQDYSEPKLSQAMFSAAEAQRSQSEYGAERAKAAAAVRDANRTRREAELETRRLENAERAQAQARLSGKDGTEVRTSIAISWPAALMNARFAGYRKVVERATALQVAGVQLTAQEHSRLARAHEAVLAMLKDHASEDGEAARDFVEGLQTSGLPRAEALAAK